MEGEPSPEALILSQGLPNLTGTICIWVEWITIPQRAPARARLGVGKRGVRRADTQSLAGGVTRNFC